MPKPTAISAPAGYVPSFALGYSDSDSNLSLVSEAKPLPIKMLRVTPTTSLNGQTATNMRAGPLAAEVDLPIIVTLAGEWTGSAQLLRSADNGATTVPLLVGGSPWGILSRNGCEQVWVESEAGTSFYLDIRITSGQLSYEVAQ